MINLAQQNTAARSTKTTNDTINNRRMLIQRSVSIDEPVPSFSSPPNVSGLRITMPKRTTTTERVLPTVSELKQDDSDEKHDVTECNTNTLAWVSPDGPLSPIARDHVHTYSSDTVSTIITSPGSSADHLLAFYVPLSPINKEQELRNESYPYHACASSGDSLLSDQDIQQIMDQVIVQCAGKHPKGGNNGLPQNNKSHSNAQNAGQHQDQSNGQNNASNNQNNNDPNDSGGSANNGSDDDDDDKKRDNRGKMDQNDDEEEQEEEEEEEKKEEDIPPPIRTNMIMSRSKSNGIHVRNDPPMQQEVNVVVQDEPLRPSPKVSTQPQSESPPLTNACSTNDVSTQPQRGSANNGGNGNADDDDDKKRDNRGKMDQNDDEEEQEEEE
eukprot:840735_1